MLLVRDGKPVKTYKVSTSKFGIGDRPGSNCTPLGTMQVAKKIGGSAQAGTVFKSRRPTGEVLKPNAPGRDPIVSRILWLKRFPREPFRQLMVERMAEVDHPDDDLRPPGPQVHRSHRGDGIAARRRPRASCPPCRR